MLSCDKSRLHSSCFIFIKAKIFSVRTWPETDLCFPQPSPQILPQSSHCSCCDHPLRSGATFVRHTSSYVPTWPRQDVIWYSALKYPPHWGKVCCQVCNVSSSSSSQAVGQNVSSEVSVVGPLLLEQAALHNWPLAQDAPPWRASAWPTENRGAWTCCRLRLLCKWDILRSYIQK